MIMKHSKTFHCHSVQTIVEEILRLEANVMRVNRIGNRVTEDSKEAVNEFTLYELGLGDQPSQAIAMVVYPRTEMESRDALLRAAELSLR